MDLKSEKTESSIHILYFNVPYQLKRVSDIQVEARIVKAELPKLRVLVMYVSVKTRLQKQKGEGCANYERINSVINCWSFLEQ